MLKVIKAFLGMAPKSSDQYYIERVDEVEELLIIQRYIIIAIFIGWIATVIFMY